MTLRASTPAGNAAPASPWQIRLLGALSASRGDERLTHFGARSVLLLLARLVIHPQRQHAREELIELLWPGVDIDAGRNRLRQTLFGLRQVLEPTGAFATPVLEADRFGVRVIPGRLDSDVTRFEAACRHGRAAEALALYGGELLPGFYDEWVVQERHRLAALADRLAATEPARGAASDRVETPPPTPAAAVRAASSGATEAAHEHRLPVYLTRFFGREHERAALRADVSSERLVTVQGPGGSGKTRLAIELATSLAHERVVFEATAFASLVDCRTRTQMLAALVVALGLHPRDEDLFGALVAGLDGRRFLLVLDNFEQLVDDGALAVAQLASALPRLHFLVTSRRALGVDGERIFSIAALEMPRPGDVSAAVADSAAVALFVDRARAGRADFGVRAANLAAVVDLVQLLEGMPLAIELAAARVRSMTPAQMATLLRAARSGAGAPAALPLLARTGPRAGTDPRHASMQSVIAWSWQLLAPHEASLLAATTVFQGGFTAAAAAAVWAQPEEDPEATRLPLALDALVGHSLLRATPFGEGGMRYTSLEPVREFAAATLSGDSRARLRARHRAWCESWARSLPATPSLPEVRAEMANVVAALDGAVVDACPEEAIRLALPLRRVLEDVELPVDGLTSLASAVERCADPVLQAQGFVLLGPLLFLAGRSAAALAAARRGLAASPPGAPWRGRALHAAARVSWRRQRSLDAELEAWVGEAADIAERSDDLELQASLFALRGFIANGGRDYANGEALHREALLRWERLGNLHAMHSGRYNLAICAQRSGRYVEALERLAEIEPRARELHDWRRLSQLLNVRGDALSGLRAWSDAVAALRECVEVAWDSLAMHELAYGMWNLPRALAHAGRPEAALRIAGFASTFWQSRFGALSASDERDLERVRRLCTRRIDERTRVALWAEGVALAPASAVALVSTLAI